MLDVVVYLLDEQYQDELSQTFAELNYVVHFADKPGEVVRLCKQEFIDLIFVWPASVQRVEDLLTVMNSKKLSHLPVIPVLSAKDEVISMLELPIAGVIPFPLPKEEFFSVIEQTVADLKGASKLLQGRFWQGHLQEFDLIDLIQMVEMSARDAMMSISYKGHTGQVYFSLGKIIRASFRNLEGMDALKKLTCLTRADFQVNFTQVKPDYAFGLETSEIFEQLKTHLNDQQNYAEKLPDLNLELKPVPKTIPSPTNELKEQILELCKNGESIYELLVVMNADNVEILQNIQELIEQEMLMPVTDHRVISKEKRKKKGITSIWGSFSGLLRKNNNGKEPTPVTDEEFEEQEPEQVMLAIKKNGIGRDEVEKFEKFLERI